ncbi:taste receptor type 2 member 40-like [Aquarana catesbeiana]|uniref:taste receptor type 2 member 40-like n=1 Tax=Aquarana catesbeiana TaxID=8400 RepID=UPI003CC93855
MPSAAEILFTTITIVQTGTGITLNTGIVSFSFQNLKKQPTFNPANVIYFSMGLVNAFMQLVLIAQNLIVCFWPQLCFIKEIELTLTFLMFSLIYCSYWHTGWLCAYYCININNFSHQRIIGLKRLLSSFLPQILLLSTIGSVILSFVAIWVVNMAFLVQTSTNSTEDMSVYTANIVMPTGYILTATFLGCILPFVLTLISTGVTALNLIKHIMKMKQNISGHSRPNLQALISATRTMILFLTLSAVFYIAELLLFSTSKRSTSDAITVIVWFIMTSFPSVEGAIIIQANPRLRKMILEKFCSRRPSSNVID